MATFEELAATFDADAHRRGKQFERLVMWWLETDAEYRALLGKVWHWSDWPGNDGADLGIDLVAEAHDGGLWAIQAKCTRADLRVTKREADSFLAASGRYPFTYRLLVTSADEIGPNLRKTFTDQYVPTGTVVRSQLLASEIDWPGDIDDLTRGAPRQPKTPRAHQLEAIEAVAAGFHDEARGQLIMACGTGKTLTALWIAERLAAQRTLVLVPSLSLLGQAFQDWAVNATASFRVCAVCSDETVTQTNDPAVAHVSDLGIPVTTDPDQIRQFLAGPDRRVVFATYQSSSRIAQAFAKNTRVAFDLVIADEAHRLVGPAASRFTTVLDNAAIPAKRRLFMTATPRYFTGRVKRDATGKDFEVASMDDHEKFGQAFHRVLFSEAIRRDLLSDYQVAVVVVDDPTYRTWAQGRRFVTRDGVEITDAGSLATQIAVAKAMHHYRLRRVISFHHRIKGAAAFAATFTDVIAWMPSNEQPHGKVWAAHLSGKFSSARRRKLLDQLRDLRGSDRGLIANARCLSEGVDVPALDGIAFSDPKRSRVDIIQAVGRALRKADDKKISTIVIPVFVGNVEDAELALNSSAFKPVWDVISALRDQDDQLAEQLDELRRQLACGKGPIKIPPKITLDVPATIRADFASAIDTALITRTTPTFEEGFARLENYVAEHGHALVPNAHNEPDGYRLGNWVNSRRVERRTRRLDPERAARLEALSGWTWDPISAQFEDGFSRLEAYAAEHGHARVPQKCVIDDGYPLGQWTQVRRTEFRQGRLSRERAARLEAVPGWTWNPHNSKFEDGFARLKAYIAQHGHARIPRSLTVDGVNLGSWVTARRAEQRAGKLDRIRAARFESLPGWAWDPIDDLFDAGFVRVEAYAAEHGHSRVPVKYLVDGHRLGAWVHRRRTEYSKSQLRPEQVARLQALPGWTWDPKADLFDEGFAQLEAYVAQHGHARVPVKYEIDGYRLGIWLAKRRSEHRHGKLDSERVARLERLPEWTWGPKADLFEEGFARLEAYVAEQGHAAVPQYVVVEGFRLGTWVNGRRSEYRKGKLHPDRALRLQRLPGWTWNPRQSAAGT